MTLEESCDYRASSETQGNGKENPDTIEVRLFSNEEIYLPLWEEGSAPLEVQLGCSWHRCKFCDFANDPLRIFSLPEIEAKAHMLSQMLPDAQRIFLLGENPLGLPYPLLEGIFDIVAQYFPQVNQVALYGRFDDVLGKTDEQLQALAQRGLVDVHIGLESGSQQVLDLMDKGIKLEDAAQACERLHRLGIRFSFTMIGGLGGRALSQEHALASARFLNLAQPARVWMVGLLLWPDTPLYQMAQAGEFEQLSFRERLLETRLMAEQLALNACTFVDSTALGQYTLRAQLPEQKELLLGAIDKLLALPGGEEYPPVPTRGHGGQGA